jgi:hypothetical protein
MRYGVEMRVGGCTLFGVGAFLSMASRDALLWRLKKWHQNIYTTYLHKRKNFKIKII